MISKSRRYVVIFIATVDVFAGHATLLAESPPKILSSQASEITDEMIGRRFKAMTLETSATDSGYGYSSDKSVSVGGGTVRVVTIPIDS